MSNTAHAANPIPENKVASKDMAETMEVFETTVMKGHMIEREPRSCHGIGYFYCDGSTNNMFKGFLHGMAFARNLVNLA